MWSLNLKHWRPNFPPPSGIAKENNVLLIIICSLSVSGLQTSQDARFYASSARFEPFSNEGKPLVIQFTVKHEQKIDCGGGYVKVFPTDLAQTEMHGESSYYLMFGMWKNKCTTEGSQWQEQLIIPQFLSQALTSVATAPRKSMSSSITRERITLSRKRSSAR